MNVKRMHRLADVVEIKHKLFNMADWVSTYERFEDGTECGTTACLAGFAVAEFHPHEWRTYKAAFKALMATNNKVPDNGHIVEAARELLDLTKDQAERLFKWSWPYEYQEVYTYAKFTNDTKGMAKAAASLLRAVADGKVSL